MASMKRDGRYGRKYWLGALVVVLSLAVFGMVAGILTGTTAGWGDNVGITLSLFMWPALIVYHFAWIGWHRSKGEQQPKNQTCPLPPSPFPRPPSV